MDPSLDAANRFRNLCRSSPWKWQSLRCRMSWLTAAEAGEARPGRAEDPAGGVRDSQGTASQPATVNCWIRRPKALRVESPDGVLLYSTTGINDSKDSLYISGNRKPWLLPAHLLTPVYDDDGLVRRRPEAGYGEPSFGDARFAALLDPVELAGNAPVPLDFPFANVAEIGPVSAVDHEGRPAVQSILTPNPSYKPSYPGHPLLFAGRTVVRIDAETGVCVGTQSLDGPGAGAGHQLTILAVDEYMLDDLFMEVSMGLTDVRQHIPWNVGPGA
ncbi:MAG: hypothetical protein M3017_17450 [Actinomycetota bacterium]|nr:hypothetical protein [Actinomycetota bacterium]